MPVSDDYRRVLDGSLEGMRVGVERIHHFPPGADPDLAGAFEPAVAVSTIWGHHGAVEVSLPYFDEMRAGLLATMLPEALAYHLGDLQTRWSDYYASTRLNLAFGALPRRGTTYRLNGSDG